MNPPDERVDGQDEAVEVELRAIALAVEELPGRTTAQSIRRGQSEYVDRGTRAALVGAKAAAVIFVAFVVAVALVVGLDRRHNSTVIMPGPSHLTPLETMAGLLAGDSGPCAGQAPGCGSSDSSAAALAAGSWSTFPAGPLLPRSGQVEVWTGKELIVWGGEVQLNGYEGPPAYLNNGAAYDPTARSWRMLPPSPLRPRTGASAAWTGTEMIVVGGEQSPPSSSHRLFRDAAGYNPATHSWRSLPPMPIEARSDAATIWTGRQLIVVGGHTASPGINPPVPTDGAVYTPASNTWARLPAVPGVAGWRAVGVTPAWTGSDLIVWVTWEKQVACGSGCGDIHTQAVGYRLAVGARRWTSLGGTNVVTDNAATAWTGSSVLVMGGWYCAGDCLPPIGYGYSYDPLSRTWSDVRSFTSLATQWPSLWNGRVFLDVNYPTLQPPWGAAGRLAAYDPAAGKWTDLPAAPAALGQSPREAVWTGRQLLVWGQSSEELTAAS